MTSVVMEANSIVDSRESTIQLDSPTKMNFQVSISGKVIWEILRHRPTVPMIVFCTDKQVARRLY